MNTPIADFVAEYQKSGTARFHMPGHKGRPFLGCEPWDITEVHGADALFEARGIIAQSEESAARLFGAARTLYSTEGSSLCIRAMVYLAAVTRKGSGRPWFLAARNAHRSFLYALALADADVTWLWPEKNHSLCSCRITADMVRQALERAPSLPAAVYITSPDYLGGQQPVAEIARVCHEFGTLLLVDNAHGAYLRFLPRPEHPMDLGADMCCDSAHKTLPVLTGGAYLHVGKEAPKELGCRAKEAMAVFGSTSPSYLILASLDQCNRYLSEGYREKLKKTVENLEQKRRMLKKNGWQAEKGEPLKITVRCPDAMPGVSLSQRLREKGVECEYADGEYLVAMASAENDRAELERLIELMGKNVWGECGEVILPMPRGEAVMSVREAVFAPGQTVAAEESLGRICAAPTVGCPPAIPIAVSGERIEREAIELFRRYGIREVSVVR